MGNKYKKIGIGLSLVGIVGIAARIIPIFVGLILIVIGLVIVILKRQ